MTKAHPDDILAQLQARHRKPLDDVQIRKLAQSLITLNAYIPGAITEQQAARLRDRFPDIVPQSMPAIGLKRFRKKQRASNRV